MTVDLEFLRDLLTAPGPSGFEEPVQEVVRRYVAAHGPATDVVGNVTAVVAVTVSVVPKAPLIVSVLAALFATPVPP